MADPTPVYVNHDAHALNALNRRPKCLLHYLTLHRFTSNPQYTCILLVTTNTTNRQVPLYSFASKCREEAAPGLTDILLYFHLKAGYIKLVSWFIFVIFLYVDLLILHRRHRTSKNHAWSCMSWTWNWKWNESMTMQIREAEFTIRLSLKNDGRSSADRAGFTRMLQFKNTCYLVKLDCKCNLFF